jgi:hypothetical protein
MNIPVIKKILKIKRPDNIGSSMTSIKNTINIVAPINANDNILCITDSLSKIKLNNDPDNVIKQELKIDYSKNNIAELKTISEETYIKGNNTLLGIITTLDNTDNTTASDPKIQTKTDLNVLPPPVKVEITEVNVKLQRKTKNLGFNTANTQDESYAKIEAQCPTARCSDGKHEGERMLPVRKFYLNKGGKGLQGACITCQNNRRANRIKRSREKFQGKTKQEIFDMYLKTYGQTKTCSKCMTSKSPSEFPISVSMETGLHNQCIVCSIGNSQGNGGLRDFIFMPDKDGIKYKKKDKCERCGGTHKLAVDHILPIAKGGTDCIPNKQTLCVHCNSKKNDRIDCVVKSEFLCNRYQDASLNFTENNSLSRILTKKVYEFRKTHIESASLADIRTSVKDYATKHNIGHNLDRIVGKIAIVFNKC